MLNKTISRCLKGLLLCASVSVAFADVVTIDGFKAYTDKVLAKVKPGRQGDRNGVIAPGVSATRSISLVPGLVILEREKSGNLQALSEEAKVSQLRGWIEALKETGDFEYVEPDYQLHVDAVPADQAFANGTLWGLNNFGQSGGVTGADISATNAWDFTTGSTNVIVGVIDSGVRYTHRELTGQMWINPGEIPANGADDDNDGYVDNVFGIDAVNRDGDPMDDNNHGTHVSGTIGASANDGNPHVGVAWQVRIMALKFLAADGFGPLSAAIECINFGTAHGCKILNNSWGGGPFTQALLDSIVAARNAGVLFVASAGNEANDNDRFPAYPASYKVDNIIAVAALDRQDRLADFSNYGRTTVHVGAPGVEIYSSVATSDTAYDLFDGTSMAAPHVSGIAALVAAYLPNATYAEIRNRITNGVVQVPSLQNRTVTGGRVNAFRAITRGVDNIIDDLQISPGDGSLVSIGKSFPISVVVTDGLSITNATVTATTSDAGGASLVFTNDQASATPEVYTASYSPPTNFPSPYNVTFTFNATAPGKSPPATPQTVTYTVVPRPVNDDFINAFKVSVDGGILSQSNTFSTIETFESHASIQTNFSGSVWYSWSVRPNPNNPSAPVPVIVDTAGSKYDTAIAVYSGTTLTNLTLVVATNDFERAGEIIKQPYVQFLAEPNISYKITILEVGTNATHEAKIRFERFGQPDTQAPVVDIQQPFSGIIIRTNKVIISGVAFDPQPNASGLAEVQLTVNDQISTTARGTTNWVSNTPLLLDLGINTIRAVAFDEARNQSAVDQINLVYQPEGAPNDIFALSDIETNDNFALLLNGPSPRIVDTTTATKEAGEPAHAGNLGGKSVWYFFRPAEDGTLFLSTQGSDFDTLLAVYVGSGENARVNQLTNVASSDDLPNGSKQSEVTIGVKAGDGYYIAIDGYDAAGGTAYLNYAFSPSTSYRVTVVPATGGNVSPQAGVFPQNSTVSLLAIPEEGFQFSHYLLPFPPFQTTQNPYSFLVTQNVTITPVFVRKQYSDDFEGGALRLPFASSVSPGGNGTNKWFIAPDPRSGSSGNMVLMTRETSDSRSLTNTLSLRTQTLAGVGQFDFGVSSETNYDRLEFWISYVDGGISGPTNKLAEWSGERTSRFQFETRDGEALLQWRYVKDVAISIGGDYAFIDNLDVPTPANPPQVTATIYGNGVLLIQAAPLQSVLIEGSQDLSGWNEIARVRTNSDGRYLYHENTTSSARYFRITGL